jgi:cell division protein ZipA
VRVARALRIIRHMDANQIRIALVILGALILGAIYWFGRPKRIVAGRLEPQLPWQNTADHGADNGFATLNDLDAEPDGIAFESDGADELAALQSGAPKPGERVQRSFDQIVSLHVMARDEGLISGGELIVAAEFMARRDCFIDWLMGIQKQVQFSVW